MVYAGLYLTGGVEPPRKFLTPSAAIKKRKGGRLSMYLCISTVVDFNSQNFDRPLMKFDKYSPGSTELCGVRRLSVRLSHSPASRGCGGFAAVSPASRRYRSIAAQLAGWRSAAAAPQQRRAAAGCGQCHVVS